MGGERAPAPDRLAQRSQVRVVEVDLDVAEADRGPVVGQVGDPVEQALGVRPRELDLEVAGGIVGADEPLASGDLVRVRAHNLLFQRAVGDLGERDGLTPTPSGELGVPGGPDVAGPVGIRQPRHVPAAADRQR